MILMVLWAGVCLSRLLSSDRTDAFGYDEISDQFPVDCSWDEGTLLRRS